jgi:hypothetical protein
MPSPQVTSFAERAVRSRITIRVKLTNIAVYAKYCLVEQASHRRSVAFDPTFARFPRFRGQDRSFDRLGQRQLDICLSGADRRDRSAGIAKIPVRIP